MMAVVVGIAGGTGAGKSWLAEALVRTLGPLEVALLRQDDYLLSVPEAVRHDPLRHNFDHPDAFDCELLAAHLASLQAGRAVPAPVFDGRSHSRSGVTRAVVPAPVVVVEGLHALAVAAIRDRLDLKVFVNTPADLRLVRRLEKDCTTRGRSWHQVTAQYLGLVRPMHEQHVEPSRRWADLVVSGAGDGDSATEVVYNRVKALLHLAF
jgi:uridine kinase